MTNSGSRRQIAVLDTSFWTAAYRTEVAANCLDFFTIIVPKAVDVEILSPHAASRREFPHATLFRHLRPQMLDAPADAPPPVRRFGAGEAAAISLARGLHVAVLMNERPAAVYADSLGLTVVKVPDFIVGLTAEGIISHRAAHRKLDLIAPITADSIISDARKTLDWLAVSEPADDGET